jgi:hypothetical protein
VLVPQRREVLQQHVRKAASRIEWPCTRHWWLLCGGRRRFGAPSAANAMDMFPATTRGCNHFCPSRRRPRSGRSTRTPRQTSRQATLGERGLDRLSGRISYLMEYFPRSEYPSCRPAVGRSRHGRPAPQHTAQAMQLTREEQRAGRPIRWLREGMADRRR